MTNTNNNIHENTIFKLSEVLQKHICFIVVLIFCTNTVIAN